MKKSIAILFAALLCVAMPAEAKFGFGVKAGLNVSKMRFDKSVVDADNRTGFFVGPMVELTLPLAGLGVDAALLYDNRKVGYSNNPPEDMMPILEKQTLHYLNIPLNLKYTLGLGSVAAVYAATGPQFSFNVGDKKNLFNRNGYNLKSSDFAWNIGAGVKLFQHLQIGYTYCIGLGKTAEHKNAANITQGVFRNFKTSTHQIAVAYLF